MGLTRCYKTEVFFTLIIVNIEMSCYQVRDMTVNYVGGPLVVLLRSWTRTTALLLILTTTLTSAHSGDYRREDINQFSVYISAAVSTLTKPR